MSIVWPPWLPPCGWLLKIASVSVIIFTKLRSKLGNLTCEFLAWTCFTSLFNLGTLLIAVRLIFLLASQTSRNLFLVWSCHWSSLIAQYAGEIEFFLALQLIVLTFLARSWLRVTGNKILVQFNWSILMEKSSWCLMFSPRQIKVFKFSATNFKVFLNIWMTCSYLLAPHRLTSTRHIAIPISCIFFVSDKYSLVSRTYYSFKPGKFFLGSQIPVFTCIHQTVYTFA